MEQPLDIREVARRTGLTSRALRFYEARGLVAPLRTYSGRRLYGAGELEQLNRVLALKRAGLTLAQIARLTRGQSLPLGKLIDAQLSVIAQRTAELAEARALLLSVKSRIDRGEPVDAETFCSLIRKGDHAMQSQEWLKVIDDHYSDDEKQEFADRMQMLPPDFDQEAYARGWLELGRRAEEVMPLGPDSPEAQQLFDDWQAHLAPFTQVATPRMMDGARRFYERMDEWKDQVPNAPFSPEAFRFIQEIGRSRRRG